MTEDFRSVPEDALATDALDVTGTAEPVRPAPVDALGMASAEEPARPVTTDAIEVDGTAEPVRPVEEETVQGLPVLAEVRTIERAAQSALPAVQAAAVAATGFVAGAATVVLVKRHGARKLARQRPGPRRAVDMLPIVGSRTFLVDVHLLAKPGE